MALARATQSGFNYWAWMPYRRSCLIVFLLSVFLVVQFFLSQEVSARTRPHATQCQNRGLNDLLLKLGKINLRSSRRCGQVCFGRTERDRVGALRWPCGSRQRRAVAPANQQGAGLKAAAARAGTDRGLESADQRVAPSARRAEEALDA
jgi:chemotaxis protein MotB